LADPVWARILGWSGLSAVLLSALSYSSNTLYPGIAALGPVIGTAAILVAGTHTDSEANRALTHPALQHLGRLSYTWYLWHWPALAIAETVIIPLPYYGRILCAVGTLGLAYVTCHLVENPIRFNRHLLGRPVLSLGLAAVVTVIVTGFTIWWHSSTAGTLFEQAELDRPRIYAMGCVTQAKSQELRNCEFGDLNSRTTVVLFGDSKAAQWFPAMERIANQRRWRLVPLLKSSCSAATLSVRSGSGGAQTQECSNWRESAIRHIVSLNPAGIVLSSYSKSMALQGNSFKTYYANWRDATRKTLMRFNEAGLRSVLVRDTPGAGTMVPLCLARIRWYGRGSCVFERANGLDDALYAAEVQATESLNNVSVVDLSDQLCGAVICEPIQLGRIVYKDGLHLTASFAESLAPVLDARVAPLLTGKTSKVNWSGSEGAHLVPSF
jgi:hypothetical protein